MNHKGVESIKISNPNILGCIPNYWN